MKKNFLYTIMALCMCLFTACSQEEIIEGTNQGGKTVSLSVSVPSGTTTRALPSEEGYKLRCIMQIVDKDNKAIAGTDMRQVVEVKAEKITFTFKAPEGDYKCLFWADFVTDINTDKIYTTSDLASITYKETANDLFSTKADAFCGYVASGTNTIQLKRPFAKVSVTPNNAADFNDFNKLTVSYNAPSGFNMVTKAVGSTAQKVTYTKTSFNASSGAWFSSYIFAPANVDKLASAITMQLAGATESKTLTIDAGKVPLNENFEINGKFDAAEGGNVNVDVSFDNEFDKPEVKAPAVGDYFYADGTWGTTINNASGSAAVGVVFDLATDDAVANYPNVGLTKINGWVVALTDTEVVKWYSEAALAAAIDGVVVLGSTSEGAINTELLGYANSTAIAAATGTFPANEACKAWSAAVPETTSKWYMPSIGQIKRLQAANSIITPKLTAASGTEVASGVYLSSTLYSKTDSGIINPMGVLLKVTDPADPNYGIAKAQKINSNYSARAILTF